MGNSYFAGEIRTLFLREPWLWRERLVVHIGHGVSSNELGCLVTENWECSKGNGAIYALCFFALKRSMPRRRAAASTSCVAAADAFSADRRPHATLSNKF